MRRLRAGAAASAVGLGLAAGYLLAWPVALEPVAWEPPALGAEEWVEAGRLERAQRVALPDGHGPEDLAVDAEGRIYTGLHDGRILRWTPDAARTELFADTGGRPLGLHFDAQGRLLVADGVAGLLRVDPDGSVETLTRRCGTTPLRFADDVDVAADGTVWFTEASARFDYADWKLDILESRAAGRLCAWSPESGETREVLASLHFANGVAVDPGQAFVLVVETSRYRVRRVWLAGPRAGQDDVFVQGLPGFPDGVSAGADGLFWLAVASPRDPLVDATAGSPWLRRVMGRLPEVLQPSPDRMFRVMGFDEEGQRVHDLVRPTGEPVHTVTSVQEHGGRLYVGSLADTAWAWMPVPRP